MSPLPTDLGRRLKASRLVLLGELAADTQHYSQAAHELLGGTFLATRADPILELRIGANAMGAAPGAYLLHVGYKDPPGGRISQRTAAAPPVAGVTEHSVRLLLATSRESVATLIGRRRLTGLTAGRRYTWQVTAGTNSGSKDKPIGRNPLAPRLAPHTLPIETSAADLEAWTCSPTAKTAIAITIGGRQYWSLGLASGGIWDDTVHPAVALGTAGSPAHFAVGASRVVVVSDANPSEVTVIDRAARTIEGTVALPAGIGRAPAITADGVTAYIPTGGGNVYPMTLASRAFGAPLAMGADLGNAQITPAGTGLWVPDFTGSQVFAVPLPAFAGPFAIALPAGCGPRYSAVGPDGGLFVCCQGADHQGRIVQILPSLAVGPTIVTTNEAGVAGGGPTSCGVAHDGVIYWSNGRAVGYSYTDDGGQFDKIAFPAGSTVGGVASSADEYIPHCWDDGAAGHYSNWPSGTIYITPSAANLIPGFAELWGDGATP